MEDFSALITQVDRLGKGPLDLLQSVKGKVTSDKIKKTI